MTTYRDLLAIRPIMRLDEDTHLRRWANITTLIDLAKADRAYNGTADDVHTVLAGGEVEGTSQSKKFARSLSDADRYSIVHAHVLSTISRLRIQALDAAELGTDLNAEGYLYHRDRLSSLCYALEIEIPPPVANYDRIAYGIMRGSGIEVEDPSMESRAVAEWYACALFGDYSEHDTTLALIG